MGPAFRRSSERWCDRVLTLVFLAIGGMGFLILMIALLFGGDADADADFDADVDGDMDAGGGHHWLSLKVLCSFATAFGAGGASASSYGLGTFTSIGVGLGCGLAIGAVANFLIAFFYSQQATSTFSAQSLKGKRGIVTLAITPGQWGEVQAQIGTMTVTRRAKAVDAAEHIDQGTSVDIVEATSTSMIVQKAQLN